MRHTKLPQNILALIPILGLGVALCSQEFGRSSAVASPSQSDTNEAGPFIQIGDNLVITISDLAGPGQDTVAKHRVDTEGNVELPHAAKVKAKGLTFAELELVVVKAYRDANLLANANVVVEAGVRR